MPEIEHIYACECGRNTRCQAGEVSLGRVFECPSCGLVCAHVYPKGGGRAWIRVEPPQVKFYDLLGKRAEAE